MNMTKIKTKALTCPIPQTDVEASNFLKEIGNIQNDMARLNSICDDQILQFKANLAKQLEPLKQRMKDLEIGLSTYCSTNRQRLTNKGKVKSHDFKTGKVFWRFSTKCKISNADAVVERLLNADLSKFVSTKKSVNREEILKNPDAVKNIEGIKVTTAESFTIEPKTTVIKGDLNGETTSFDE